MLLQDTSIFSGRALRRSGLSLHSVRLHLTMECRALSLNSSSDPASFERTPRNAADDGPNIWVLNIFTADLNEIKILGRLLE